MNEGNRQIRILHVGEAKEARQLRGLLGIENSQQFQVRHIPAIGDAADCLSRNGADILLLDIGQDPLLSSKILHVAGNAASRVATVILSDARNDVLAIESIQKGVQDFLSKEGLNSESLGRSLRYAIERHRVQKTLQNLSLTDDLTGLQNRRGFFALAEQHMRLILRKGAALLVYVDLDGLKGINDTHGHLQGNRALIATANVLRSSFRKSDILGRIGGDEFCVLMTDSGQNTAEQVRKRLRQRVRVANARSSATFRLSLSFGIVNVPVVHQPPLEDLIHEADARMYEDKRGKQLRAAISEPLECSIHA